MKKTTCFLIITMLLFLLLPSCGEMQKEAEMSAIREAALADGAITVVLDAGHGLGDVGALNEENLGEVTEAEINFAFTMLVKDGLESRGYTVILTHDGETKPDTAYDDGKPTYGPGERADFSNAQPADVFLSFHSDSFPSNADVYGTRVYYPVNTPNATAADKLLAEAVKTAIDAAFPDGKAVGLRDMHGEDCYTVLYRTTVPSVLIEIGFISNAGDAARLTDATFRTTFADAVCNAIDAYFGAPAEE